MIRINLRLCLGVSLLVMMLGVSTSFAQTLIPTAFVAWSPDGTMIAVGIDDRVDIVDVDSASIANSIFLTTSVGENETPPVWSSNGDMLAVTNGPDVQVWLSPWSASTQQLMSYQYYDTQPTGDIEAMAWSPNDTEMAIAVGDYVDIWEIVSGNRLRSFTDDWGVVRDLIWDIDRITISTSRSYAVNLDSVTGEIINYYGVFEDGTNISAFNAIDFSADGNQMVIANQNGLILIWGDTRTSEVYSGTPRISFQHGAVVTDVDWSPDGAYIASAGWDGNIVIWDADTGEQVEVISLGENIQANSVAWSPDGSQLAYGTAEGIGVEIVPAPMRDEDGE